jgi:hypothetical protein
MIEISGELNVGPFLSSGTSKPNGEASVESCHVPCRGTINCEVKKKHLGL